MEKKEKKGFWASLFTSKPCKCSQSGGYEIPSTPVTPAAGFKVVKVLGPGCSKCKTTYKVVEKVISDNALDVSLVKVEDIEEIMRYNLLSTPAVAILTAGEDAPRVVVKGKVPTEAEVRQLLGL